MSTVSEVAASTRSTSLDTVRIGVVAPDDDLRAWIIDELSLMTWIGSLQLETVASLAPDELRADDRDILIVGLDSLDAGELQRLRERTWTTPTIAIGAVPEGLAFERALASRATSRELRQALRELLARTKR